MTQAGAEALIWRERGKRLIEEVLYLLDSEEVFGHLGAADMCLRIANGDRDPEELEGYPFPGEERQELCICPPDLRARGGYEGGCRGHGLA